MSWLRECPDRVIADLRRFYGVRLSDMYAGREDVLEVAHMVAHMPRGGAMGEWVGGEHALTAEVQSLWSLEHLTVAVASDKPKKVKPRPLPEGVREIERKKAIKTDNIRRWRAKHG